MRQEGQGEGSREESSRAEPPGLLAPADPVPSHVTLPRRAELPNVLSQHTATLR